MLESSHSIILALVELADAAIVGSIDENGFPNIKALLKPRKIEDNARSFYFTTNTSSMRVDQFRKNPKATLYFYSARYFRGIMLTGTMEVLEDEASKQKIWKDGDDLYYKE